MHIPQYFYQLFIYSLFVQYLMDQILHISKRHTLKRNLFIGIGAFSLFKILYSYALQRQAESQIAFRKSQLQKPIYQLKGQQLVNFPWDQQNKKQWLYRRVKVTGRPMHYRACLIPRTVYHLQGYQYVLPLVTQQSKAGETQNGIVFSKGFLPAEYKSPSDRRRIQDVDQQTFVGFLSNLSELSDHGILQGNSSIFGRLTFTHSNLKDLAQATGFKNQKQASVALLERLQGNTPLDERNSQLYAHDSQYGGDYPYAKTAAGALQLSKMPWDYSNDRQFWFSTILVSGLLAFI